MVLWSFKLKLMESQLIIPGCLLQVGYNGCFKFNRWCRQQFPCSPNISVKSFQIFMNSKPNLLASKLIITSCLLGYPKNLLKEFEYIPIFLFYFISAESTYLWNFKLNLLESHLIIPSCLLQVGYNGYFKFNRWSMQHFSCSPNIYVKSTKIFMNFKLNLLASKLIIPSCLLIVNKMATLIFGIYPYFPVPPNNVLNLT